MTQTAPERIWAKTDAKPSELENWYLEEYREGMTEYVRADLTNASQRVKLEIAVGYFLTECDHSAMLEVLEKTRCRVCQGSGERNDAEAGDISFSAWVCNHCGGKGWNRIAVSELVAAVDFSPISALTPASQSGSEAARVLEVLEAECWDLRCIDIPNGDAGDADIWWQLVSHHMSKPHERIEGAGISPIQAFRDALAQEGE